MGRRAEAFNLPDEFENGAVVPETGGGEISDEALKEGLIKAAESGLIGRDEKPKRRSHRNLVRHEEAKEVAEAIIGNKEDLEEYITEKATELAVAPELRTEAERQALRNVLEKVTQSANALHAEGEVAPVDRAELERNLKEGIKRLTTKRKKATFPKKKVVPASEDASVVVSDNPEPTEPGVTHEESTPEKIGSSVVSPEIQETEDFIYENAGAASLAEELDKQVARFCKTNEDVTEWLTLREIGANRVLTQQPRTPLESRVQKYLQGIAAESGLEPRHGLLRRNETVEQFGVRATEKIFADKNPRS